MSARVRVVKVNGGSTGRHKWRQDSTLPSRRHWKMSPSAAHSISRRWPIGQGPPPQPAQCMHAQWETNTHSIAHSNTLTPKQRHKLDCTHLAKDHNRYSKYSPWPKWEQRQWRAAVVASHCGYPNDYFIESVQRQQQQRQRQDKSNPKPKSKSPPPPMTQQVTGNNNKDNSSK